MHLYKGWLKSVKQLKPITITLEGKSKLLGQEWNFKQKNNYSSFNCSCFLHRISIHSCVHTKLKAICQMILLWLIIIFIRWLQQLNAEPRTSNTWSVSLCCNVDRYDIHGRYGRKNSDRKCRAELKANEAVRKILMGVNDKRFWGLKLIINGNVTGKVAIKIEQLC